MVALTRVHGARVPDRRQRRVPVAQQTMPWVVAPAIPEGMIRAPHSHRWAAQVFASWPATAPMRADAYANLMAVAHVLAASADFETSTSRPGHQHIMDVAGVSESTVTRCIRRLKSWGLIGTVAEGRQGAFVPIEDAADPANPDANEAALYVLCQPANARRHLAAVPDQPVATPPVTDAGGSSSVDVSDGLPVPNLHLSTQRTPPSRAHEENTQAEPLRGTTDRAAARPPSGAAWRNAAYWPAAVTPRSKDQRFWAARELQRRVPALNRTATGDLRRVINEYLLAGWNVLDLIHAIDHQPDGTTWPHDGAHAVRIIRAWLAYRLKAWRDEHGTIRTSRTQQLMAQRHEHLVRQRVRAEHDAARRAQRGTEPEHDQAKEAVVAWWIAFHAGRTSARSPEEYQRELAPRTVPND